MRKIPLEERFWSRVNPFGPLPPLHPELGPCWLWTGKPNHDGYGRIRVDKSYAPLVHRHLWEKLNGPLEDGYELDHLCEVRACVRPSHLEVVTHEENVRRGRGGEHWAAKTHCPQEHAYDEENTRINGKGARVCRRCSTDKARDYRLANPEKHREAVRRYRRTQSLYWKGLRAGGYDSTYPYGPSPPLYRLPDPNLVDPGRRPMAIRPGVPSRRLASPPPAATGFRDCSRHSLPARADVPGLADSRRHHADDPWLPVPAHPTTCPTALLIDYTLLTSPSRPRG